MNLVTRSLLRRTLGRQFSEGARLLWFELGKRGWDQSAAARELGTSSGTVNRWLYGERRPSAEWAARIESVLAIPARTFGEPPTQEFEPPAAESA